MPRHDRWLALAACLAACGAAASELGTLFHTPEERQRLERERRGEDPTPVAAGVTRAEVTGFVRRSDGRNTIWINGVPVVVASPSANALLEPRTVRAPGQREVRIERSPGAEVKR